MATTGTTSDYVQMNVHVPTSSHDKLIAAITRSGAVSIKIDLTGQPTDVIYVTPAQKRRLEDAVAKGKKQLTLRFSVRQARHNIHRTGGFLGTILSAAARYLPAIIAGISAGADAYHSTGNGMFLGRRDRTVQIRHNGEGGLVLTPAEHTKKLRGFYVKHDGKVYQGKGLLHGLFGQIPILNLLF